MATKGNNQKRKIFFSTPMTNKENRELRSNEKSAIIGYWRNGMTLEEISVVMDISTFEVERIVFNYTKGIK